MLDRLGTPTRTTADAGSPAAPLCGSDAVDPASTGCPNRCRPCPCSAPSRRVHAHVRALRVVLPDEVRAAHLQHGAVTW